MSTAPRISVPLSDGWSVPLFLEQLAWVGTNARVISAVGPEGLVRSFMRSESATAHIHFGPVGFVDITGMRKAVGKVTGGKGLRHLVMWSPSADGVVRSQETPSAIVWDGSLEDAVFRRLDKGMTVPLLPEWREALVTELVNRRLVVPWNTWSWDGAAGPVGFDVGVTDDQLRAVVGEMVRAGELAIPDGLPGPAQFVENYAGQVTAYLSDWGKTMAEHLLARTGVRHDPGSELPALLTDLKRPLFRTQADACAAILKTYEAGDRAVWLSGTTGVGKTSMGLAVGRALIEGGSGRILAMVPPHLLKKWEREAKTVLPDVAVHQVNSWQDALAAIPDLSRQPETSELWLVGRDQAKYSHFWRPCFGQSRARARRLRRTLRSEEAPDVPEVVLTCPDCGEVLARHTGRKKATWVFLGEEDFANRTTRNAWCPKCHASLWEATGPRRVSFAKIWKRGIRGRQPFDLLILDESHEEKGDSEQGRTFGRLVPLARRVLLQSGTLIGGKASDLFFLLARTIPDRLKAHGYQYEEPMGFVKAYGSRVFRFESNTNGKMAREGGARHEAGNEKPGIHPAVYGDWLMPRTVFVSLEDVGVDLPPYEERVMQLGMSEEQVLVYQAAIASAKQAIFQRLFANGKTEWSEELDKRLLQYIVQFALAFPDRTWSSTPATLRDGTLLWDGSMTVPESELTPKEDWLWRYAVAERARQRRVMVYVQNTQTYDVSVRLGQVMAKHGLRVARLTRAVRPEEREDWLAERAQRGVDVVVTHPRLVSTGLDFTGKSNFPSLVFGQTGYNLNELRQASGRSWRIGQTEPVEVTYLAYKDTIQTVALQLMGAKLVAAQALEGKFSEDGLSSLGYSQNDALKLAKALFDEIEDVADLGAVWRVIGDGEKVSAPALVSADMPLTRAEGTPEPILAPVIVPLGRPVALPAPMVQANEVGGALSQAAVPRRPVSKSESRRRDEMRRLYGGGLFGEEWAS